MVRTNGVTGTAADALVLVDNKTFFTFGNRVFITAFGTESAAFAKKLDYPGFHAEVHRHFAAFGGSYPTATVWSFALAGYLIYVFTSLLDTPFVYLGRKIVRKYFPEG